MIESQDLQNASSDFSDITVVDLLERFEVYEYIYKISDPLKQTQELERLAQHGKTLKVVNVKSIYRSYLDSLKKTTTRSTRYTAWDGQDLELETSWTCDESGIHKFTGDTEEYASSHPLTISQRIYNIDTGLERIELQYKTGSRWRRVIVDKSTIASPTKIIELSNYGISVTSDNAKQMIAYLQELESMNYSAIPTIEATSRLGWVTDEDFMPYSDAVSFDGDPAFSRLFNSVKSEGSFDAWISTIKMMMRKHASVRIAMAAAALSPILALIGAQPSFVHIWSSMSATGKTLIAMAAASFWGNPSTGEYMQSFNATTVAMERIAETLNSLPLVMDELQLAQKYKGESTFSVYNLAQGQGKGRGTKTGGIDRVPTWCNTIITTGETPIVGDSSGQGAAARVLEVEINEVIFDSESGNNIAKSLRSNYGWAGERWLVGIKALGAEKLSETFNNHLKNINQTMSVQDKQAILAASLMTAAEYADLYIYGDDQSLLSLEDLEPFLMSRQQTSVEQRALEFIADWVTTNRAKFRSDAPECYGLIDEYRTYIIRTVFNQAVRDEGYNPKTVLSAFARKGWIETSQEGSVTRTDVRKRIGDMAPRCVALKTGNGIEVDNEILPYEF